MYRNVVTQTHNPALPRSGCIVGGIDYLDVTISISRAGGCYAPIPEEVSNIQAAINPLNNDNRCFVWEAISALHHNEIPRNKGPISRLKPYLFKYNWSDLDYPTSYSSIKAWEVSNRIRVNIISWEQEFYMIKNDGDNDYPIMINLLQIFDGSISHYAAITDLNHLLSSQINSDRHRKFHCSNCLRIFVTEEVRDDHHEICGTNPSPLAIRPSTEDHWLEFSNYRRMLAHPGVIYLVSRLYNSDPPHTFP